MPMAAATYLESLGVADIPASTVAFDPGYDVGTLKGHIHQSSHLILALKLSMACWQIAGREATLEKIEAARSAGIEVCTGGGPMEVACACRKLPEYLDLCAELGFDCIEAGQGFVDIPYNAEQVVSLAHRSGLEVIYEIGEKHSGAFTDDTIVQAIKEGKTWLDAGAKKLVVEARESAQDVGLFNHSGKLDLAGGQQIVETFGLDRVIFEAPNKQSQFSFIRHFGPRVQLCNVRFEELLRVEIFRRGLHSDSFMCDNLQPANAADLGKRPA